MEAKLGKIDQSLIAGVIAQQCGKSRKEVLTGPQFGVDVSVVALPGGMAMAATSDPLSLIPSLGLEKSAWLSVHLAANDIATTGFAPMYGQFVLNLPGTFSKEDFGSYWGHVHRFSEEIGLAITGGHTGFIADQHSTIAGGVTLFTIAPAEQVLTSKKAGIGDAILVTKECAISSAAILALSFPETVIAAYGKEVHESACALFYQTSSLPDALAAISGESGRAEVTAMHDVTEGGVLGAIYEMASASGHGARVDKGKIPLGEVTGKICSLFSIDPYHSVGAGAMIITCKPMHAAAVMERLHLAGIACSCVGEIREKAYGIQLAEGEQESEMAYMETDPYWAAFFTAMEKGWT
ncbi:hypothetical protein P872_11730 [Rhodonellum psychrophilum GCM71 = DSM 17998]|uniref:AIR synthase n=2 Tax=Rhodonellum TaxID=336827 RepID=U5BKI4_9BACT|nr:MULTISPECIES: AIR synthase family protein [Rhodonellum]ERM80970.1 hypothetical protein P872_11730 [Rhodonellum psychrophilum GCM71 = DSM 17998]SDZ55424.1 Hydrogenase maturation factor [Rhodonellum ikkaensis]